MVQGMQGGRELLEAEIKKPLAEGRRQKYKLLP
jgi:hypothetical protein